MAEGKVSFKINGFQYTDIKGGGKNDNIYISVAGTAQMIRQWMKAKYPEIPTSYYWVKSKSFANGDSIDVYLNEAPIDLKKKIEQELDAHFEYGSQHTSTQYSGKELKRTTDDGKNIQYGTKYLFVNNEPPYDAEKKEVNWNLSKKEEKTSIPRTKSGAEKKSYPMGEMLNDCSGWSIFKKTLPDGRIVYNAKIKAETPKNRGDWATIKGEIYTDTTFKWGRFGAFERWGNIPNESETIEKLCQILGKYYESGEQPAPSEEPKVDPSLPEVGDRFFVKTEGGQTIYEIMKMEMGTVFVQPDGSEWDVPYSFADAKNNFAEGRWVKIQDEEAEETPAPEAPKKSKEDIEKAIKGLQFLADKGNEKAKKAIIGLKILLNK